MKGIFFKYTYFIIIIGRLIIWVTALIMGKYTNIPRVIICVGFIAFQTLISVKLGNLIQSLHIDAYGDVLTGLHNRRYFYQKLSNTMSVKMPVSLIIIDIDDFKGINDNYGHITGDIVLKQFADILKENVRASDTVVRWGGEEFAVILPETHLNKAYLIGDRIRGIVENYRFSSEATACKVTVSIGITATETEIDMDEFVKIADKALYKAKETKNLVICINSRNEYVMNFQ